MSHTQMKLFTQLEKLFTPYALLVLNVAIILAVEFLGGGRFFEETGIVHAIAIIFVGLIIVQIFSDYAFSDFILKRFLAVQLAFFLFLGLVHIYEYVGLRIITLDEGTVEQSVMISYLIWILGVFLSFASVSRIYYKRSMFMIALLSVLISMSAIYVVGINVSSVLAQNIMPWFHLATFACIVLLGVGGIMYMNRVAKIMPVFGAYARYAKPAIIFLIFAALFEYFESTHFLSAYGISDTQDLYIAHFLIYATLSLLFVGFSKFKNPSGIYEEKYPSSV